jgi:sigma-E factor negative regulatory protein RseA
MTDQVKEQVSALLDGELPSSECSLLFRRLSKEREFGVAAGRYLLIGEAMRGVTASGPVCSPTRGFADRVMAALDEEAARPDEQADNAMRLAQARRASTARWLKTGGGLAIAASVGAAAVLFIQLPPAAKLSPVASAAIGTPATRQVLHQEPVQVADAGASTFGLQPSRSLSDDMGIREVSSTSPVYSNGRLTNYVVAHSEYSSPLGRRNVLTGLLAEDADLPEVSSGTAPVSWATR